MRGKNPTRFTAGGISLAMAYQASNSIVATWSLWVIGFRMGLFGSILKSPTTTQCALGIPGNNGVSVLHLRMALIVYRLMIRFTYLQCR